MSTPTVRGGRRRATVERRRPRPNPTLVLAVLLPLATIGALAVVDQEAPAPTTMPPAAEPLDRTDLGCPAADGALLVSAHPPPADPELGEATGEGSVELRTAAGLDQDEEPEPLSVEPGAVTRVEDRPEETVITGRQGLAPGLLAARTGGTPLAVTGCPPPRAETWFAGLGARADHASVLELVNPDNGAAVIDVDVFARRGVLDVPDLRGLRLPGRSAVRIDLAATVPRRVDVSVRVAISRGRAAVTALDQVGDIGGDPSRDWVPGQVEPAVDLLLLGVPQGPGTRLLSLLNPGDDEARATVQVVAPESVFAPAGVEEVRIAPRSTVSLTLDDVLADETRRGAVGILVEGTRSVVASLASVVDDDLSVAGAPAPFDDEAVALIPRGDARLVLAGAASSGVVIVISRAEDGTVLDRTRHEVGPERSASVDLPDKTASVLARVRRTTVVGSVLVTGPGATVVPLVVPDTVGFVPVVRPGLP